MKSSSFDISWSPLVLINRDLVNVHLTYSEIIIIIFFLVRTIRVFMFTMMW